LTLTLVNLNRFL